MSRTATAITELATTTTHTETIGYGDNRLGQLTVTRYVATSTRAARDFVRLSQGWIALCPKCGGSGNVESTIWQGICFRCNGGGITGEFMGDAELATVVRRWGLAARRAAAKTAAKVATVDAERTAWRADHADLITWAQSLTPTDIATGYESTVMWHDDMAAVTAYHPGAGWYLHRTEDLDNGKIWAQYLRDLEEFGLGGADDMIRVLRWGGRLNARETAYLTKVAASYTTRDAGRHSGAVGDTVTITGEIKTAKVVDGHYGNSVFLVITGTGTDTGITWTTYSTAKAAWAAEPGQQVTATAQIKALGEYRGSAQDKVTRIKLG